MEKNIKVYWVVLISLVITSVFIFIETAQDDSDLVLYFGFAGSVTSLVLGLIAIFYSIISNQQSTENFGKLKEAVTKVEEGAATMKSITENINSRLDKISDQIKFGTKNNDDQAASAESVASENPIQQDSSADIPDVGSQSARKENKNG